MFARLTRLPLRRCIHTSASPPQSWSRTAFTRAALGASAVTATYLTWRLTSDKNHIALDSPDQLHAVEQSPLSHKSTSKLASSSIPPKAAPESPFIADPAPSPSDESSDPTEASPESSPLSNPKADEADTNAEAEEGSSDQGASGGAYNPVTGEINWDCPCLGGMAHGPCGPQFREAFSCFVFSEDEPKGINCVDKFQAMQTCFREHPEVYGDEIMDDDEEEPATATEGAVPITPTNSASENVPADAAPSTDATTRGTFKTPLGKTPSEDSS